MPIATMAAQKNSYKSFTQDEKLNIPKNINEVTRP
jgi:hypothetical protein